MIQIKVGAFTLIELLVSLLISSILSALIYLSLSFIYQRQKSFISDTEEMIIVSALRRVMNHDFQGASYVWKSDGKTVNCVSDSSQIVYVFEDEFILRMADNQTIVTDTFQLSCQGISFKLDGNEVLNNENLMDAITFKVKSNSNNYFVYLVQRPYTIGEKLSLENRLQ